MRSRDRDHETAVRYLLGELPERECDELEQSYFGREGGFEELQAIEAELIDSYVAGELSPDQRRRFEGRFPTKERGEAIEFARVLKAAFPDAAAGRPTAGPPSPRRRPVRWYPFAAALLFLAVGWWSLRSSLGPPGPESPGPERTPSPPLPGGGASPRSTPESSEPGSPTPTAAPSRTLSVTLAAGLVREGRGMTRLVVPPDTERVIVTLVLEDASASSYHAVFQNASAQELFRRGPLQPHARGPGRALSVSVPAGFLVAGDYVVLLRSVDYAGHLEDRAEYAFRVVRRE